MKIRAKCPASIGELIQGKIYGKELLVSCPIREYSILEIEICKNHDTKSDCEKVYKAFGVFIDSWGLKGINPLDIKVTFISRLPRGKGMASSTADIGAGLAALSYILACPLSEEDMASIAIDVEPTDSIVFSHLTLFDHLKGKHIEKIGPVPTMEFLLLEGREAVDTMTFRKDSNYINLVANLDREYENFYKAIKQGDAKLLAKVCTESAFANQKFFYKPYLEKLYNIAMDCGALGINTAHSGSVSGVIIGNETNREKLLFSIQKTFEDYFEKIYFTHTTKGGAQIIYSK
jgi:L-threonine kinase